LGFRIILTSKWLSRRSRSNWEIQWIRWFGAQRSVWC